MLEIRGLTKQLGENTVLDDVSFQIPEGEFFVLLGPSGSGKSTLLRVVCGLEQPDHGQVLIDGRDITGLPPRSRNLAMVFQDYGLYPNMNVYQNIAYGLETRRVPGDEIRQRIVEAAAKLGLTDLLTRTITDLSGGEQQRVALARAMVKDADTYLFDEPLSNLDPKLRFQARQDILRVHLEKQRPSLYVTHDQAEAFAMADRIALLHQGRMQQIGTAEELLYRPANLFVARFVGTPPMNLLRGAITRNGTAYIFQAGGLAVTLPAHWHASLAGYDTKEVILGFRPETVARVDQPGEFEITHENSFTSQVIEIEELIGETLVTLQAGAGTTLQAIIEEDLFSQSGDGGDLVVGQALEVGVDQERLTLFDPDSEQALVAGE
jgi:multiple sugar transport system ATP-binding protein